ncbi:hypothetical protein BJX70DRAFT_118826 [Aspergillus crustosus]
MIPKAISTLPRPSLTETINAVLYHSAMRRIFLCKIRCLNIYAPRLTYNEGPFGSERLRAAMAGLINTYFHPMNRIEATNIVLTIGVTSLNATCALSLTDSRKDGILLGQPIYGCCAGDITALSGCQMIYTPFDGNDQFNLAAVAHPEKALIQTKAVGITAKALMIWSPHSEASCGSCPEPCTVRHV